MRTAEELASSYAGKEILVVEREALLEERARGLQRSEAALLVLRKEAEALHTAARDQAGQLAGQAQMLQEERRVFEDRQRAFTAELHVGGFSLGSLLDFGVMTIIVSYCILAYLGGAKMNKDTIF